jgi:hypothetical protein
MEIKVSEDLGEEIIKELRSLIAYLENKLREKGYGKEFTITPCT